MDNPCERVVRENPHLRPSSPDRQDYLVFDGVELRRYPSKGYSAIHMKGKCWGRKTSLGKALYKEDLLRLARALLREARVAKTYKQSHAAREVNGYTDDA